MKRLDALLAATFVAMIVVLGLAYSTSVQAQGGREVEVKRLKMSASEQITTHTLGVPTGISCLERNNGVECFVVSTR